ncbi:MAG: DNA methyltransferase [Myxococcota bacterium]
MYKIPGVTPYYEKERFVLYHGDSIDLLPQLPEQTLDMVFADPPYNLSNGGFTCQGGKRVSVNKGDWDRSQGIEADFAFHREWIALCKSLLKPEGTIWISGSYHSIYACGYALQLEGFKLLNDICWFKPNASPNLSCRYFTASHESLLWALKDPRAKHTFNYDIMKNGEWYNQDLLKKQGKQMRSVWSISTARGSEKRHGKHPTQKPKALLDRVVRASTSPGDIVLDPFTGSSTAGLLAYEHGRHFIGIERKKEYLDLSIRRFEALVERLQQEPATKPKKKQKLLLDTTLPLPLYSIPKAESS